MEKDEFDFDDEYNQYRRRQRIHRMHLVGYVVSGVLILIGMIVFWRSHSLNMRVVKFAADERIHRDTRQGRHRTVLQPPAVEGRPRRRLCR